MKQKKSWRTLLIISVLLCLLPFSGCQMFVKVEFIDEAYVQRYELDTYEFVQEIQKREEGRILLSEVISVEWDRIYTFFGYAGRKEIYDKVGYKWRKKIADQDQESDYLLVFMQGDEVVYDIKGPRLGVQIYEGNCGSVIYASEAPEIQITKNGERIGITLCPE